jgi:O-antigen polymerase
MKRSVLVSSFMLILLLSSFLSTLSFRNYLFIHAISYILLTFCIIFLPVLLIFTIGSLNKKKFKIDFNLFDISILALVVYIIARYAFSLYFNAMPDTVLFFILLLIFFFYIRNTLGKDTMRDVRIILYSILFIGALQAIYSLLQLKGLLPNLFDYKLGGSFGNPGDLANFLIITYTISLGLFFYENKRTYRFILLGSVILHLFVIIVSQARTAWIAGTITSFIVIYIVYFSHFNISNFLVKRKKYITIFIFLILILITVWASYKLYNFKITSTDGRVFIWKNCLQIIKEKPFFGHGYESFQTEIRQTQISYFKNNPGNIKNGLLAGNPVFAFNDYLQMTAEYGIVGLFILLFIIFRAFSFKNTNKTEKKLSLLAISRVTVIAILVSMLFSYPLENPTILICFFILLAIISSSDENVILKFGLKRKYVMTSSFIFCMLLGFLFAHSFNSIKNGLKWKKTFEDSENNNGNYVLQYDNLFKTLKHDRSFIMNYGSILYKSGNYNSCINIYEKYGYLCLSSDMYLLLGESYEKTKKYAKAEENYKNASFSIPHLFMPKYRLFKLYGITCKPDKVDSIARQISKMKIKVYSDEVKEIKTEINKYLLLKNEYGLEANY